jgi:hypothetical protein
MDENFFELIRMMVIAYNCPIIGCATVSADEDETTDGENESGREEK